MPTPLSPGSVRHSTCPVAGIRPGARRRSAGPEDRSGPGPSAPPGPVADVVACSDLPDTTARGRCLVRSGRRPRRPLWPKRPVGTQALQTADSEVGRYETVSPKTAPARANTQLSPRKRHQRSANPPPPMAVEVFLFISGAYRSFPSVVFAVSARSSGGLLPCHALGD